MDRAVSVFLFSLGVLGLLCWILASLWWCTFLYYSVQRKGYSVLFSVTVAFGGALVGSFGGAWATASFDSPARSLAVENAVLFISSSVGIALAGLVPALLPRRSSRHAGARSAPFLTSDAAVVALRVLTWSRNVLLVLSAIGVVRSFTYWRNHGVPWEEFGRHVGPPRDGIVNWEGLQWLLSREFTLGFAAALFGFMLHTVKLGLAYTRIRAMAPSLEEVVRIDSRPPVVYLRPFRQEDDGFAAIPDAEVPDYPEFAEFSKAVAGLGSGSLVLTLEQYLGDALVREIGPFVALGNPEDGLPPEGAARMYAQDADWQRHFLSLAEGAEAIVMGVGRSESLRTEMAAIKAGHWHRKLFVVTPCIGGRARNSIVRAGAAFKRTAKGTYRDAEWQSLANDFNEAGFRIDIAEPGFGSVVSFDDAGHAEVIAENLAEPTEFVQAIQRRLEEVREGNVTPTAIESPPPD